MINDEKPVAEVQITAERFAVLVRNHKMSSAEADAPETTQLDLMRAVMREQWPSYQEEAITKALVFNTVKAELKKTGREITNRLVSTGTIDMFGHPGFKVFEELDGKKWDMTTIQGQSDALKIAWEQKHRENDELKRTLERGRTKEHAYYSNWQANEALCDAVMRAGYDPSEMTFEQAKAQGVPIHASGKNAAGKKAGL